MKRERRLGKGLAALVRLQGGGDGPAEGFGQDHESAPLPGDGTARSDGSDGSARSASSVLMLLSTPEEIAAEALSLRPSLRSGPAVRPAPEVAISEPVVAAAPAAPAVDAVDAVDEPGPVEPLLDDPELDVSRLDVSGLDVSGLDVSRQEEPVVAAPTPVVEHAPEPAVVAVHAPEPEPEPEPALEPVPAPIVWDDPILCDGPILIDDEIFGSYLPDVDLG